MSEQVMIPRERHELDSRPEALAAHDDHVPRRPASQSVMTPEEEYEYYSKAENLEPQGPPMRLRPDAEPIPVRLPQQTLERVKIAAAKDNRSVASWIRRATILAIEAEAPDPGTDPIGLTGQAGHGAAARRDAAPSVAPP